MVTIVYYTPLRLGRGRNNTHESKDVRKADEAVLEKQGRKIDETSRRVCDVGFLYDQLWKGVSLEARSNDSPMVLFSR